MAFYKYDIELNRDLSNFFPVRFREEDCFIRIVPDYQTIFIFIFLSSARASHSPGLFFFGCGVVFYYESQYFSGASISIRQVAAWCRCLSSWI